MILNATLCFLTCVPILAFEAIDALVPTWKYVFKNQPQPNWNFNTGFWVPSLPNTGYRHVSTKQNSYTNEIVYILPLVTNDSHYYPRVWVSYKKNIYCLVEQPLHHAKNRLFQPSTNYRTFQCDLISNSYHAVLDNPSDISTFEEVYNVHIYLYEKKLYSSYCVQKNHVHPYNTSFRIYTDIANVLVYSEESVYGCSIYLDSYDVSDYITFIEPRQYYVKICKKSFTRIPIFFSSPDELSKDTKKLTTVYYRDEKLYQSLQHLLNNNKRQPPFSNNDSSDRKPTPVSSSSKAKKQSAVEKREEERRKKWVMEAEEREYQQSVLRNLTLFASKCEIVTSKNNRTCHEVSDIDQKCSSVESRKQCFNLLLLKLHPDKNAFEDFSFYNQITSNLNILFKF